MAYIELNALSVCLSGTFEACVFAPEPEGLREKEAFPVLWYIHEDGDSPYGILKYTDILERMAVEKRMFIIAPAVSHSLCTDMVWGTKNETFLAKECVEIFRFMYPLSTKPEENTVIGIGTGAYGACKLALNHPDVFGAGIAIEGELDLAGKCRSAEKACAGEDGRSREFPFQSRASLEAIFGDLTAVEGSRNDLYAAAKDSSGKLRLMCGADSPVYAENARLAGVNPNIILDTADGKEHKEDAVKRQLEKIASGV